MKLKLFITLLIITLFVWSCTLRSKDANTTKELELLPAKRNSVLQEEGYVVWGSSMVQDENGLNHLYYCRWKGDNLSGKIVNAWAEIVHATSNDPLGPYTSQEVVLGREPEGDDLWYGLASLNPQVVEFDGKYYLYYTGSNGSNFPIEQPDGSFKKSPKGTLITQRVGVAVADSPWGPWKRIKKPLIDISNDGIDSQMTTNPSVTRDDKGNYLMVYKCSAGRETGIHISYATADNPLGPFKKSNKKIFVYPGSKFPVEDPFVWFQNGKYQCILDAQNSSFAGDRCLIRFESNDGMNWEKADPFVFSKRQIQWEDGELEEVHHFEKQSIWFKNGKPAMLTAAVWQNKKGYNVQIPMKGLAD